jgi:hypothetical protein
MFPKHIATIVSLIAVANPLGGTIGHTLMSTVFNNVAGVDPSSDLKTDFGSVLKLPEEQRAAVIERIKMGIIWAYVTLVPFMVLVRFSSHPPYLSAYALIPQFQCVLAASLLGTVILPKGKGSEEDRSNNIVIHEPYPWALLRGTSRSKTWERVEASEMDELTAPSRKVERTREESAYGGRGMYEQEEEMMPPREVYVPGREGQHVGVRDERREGYSL